MRFGPFELQPARRLLLRDGQPVTIGARAFDVLVALAARRHRLVSKNELLDEVWPGVVVEEANIQVQISALRKLLGPDVIRTVPGRGYQFVAEVADGERSPDTIRTSKDELHEPRGNLPAAQGVLHGRDEDLAALATLLREHRLVSIVGPGGVGKTRLALAVANRLPDLPDGAWVVPLAGLSDPGVLPATVAQALGLALQSGRDPSNELADALRDRELLLVIDNCEHLNDSVRAFVAALLAATRRLKVCTTSQDVLNVPGEHVYRRASLALPATRDLEGAKRSGAVALFVDRIRALDSTFSVSSEHVGDVIEICERLDGLPLALELAASRVPLLGVTGLRERLDQRFRVLTGGPRTAPRRHQTLRQTLEWSEDLLSEQQRSVFRRVGVFAGGFSMRAAQSTVADRDIDEWAVLDALGELVNKSLVVAEPGEPRRYKLLETARSYALKRLDSAGERQSTLDRHALAMIELFETALGERWSVGSAKLVERYVSELDNLRLALDWTFGRDPNRHVALAGASLWIWDAAGQPQEGSRRAKAALGRLSSATPIDLEARLQREWAGHARKKPDPSARLAAERSVELHRKIGDRAGLYLSLAHLSVHAAQSMDVRAARRASTEMAALLDPTWPANARWEAAYARSQVAFIDGGAKHGTVIVESLMRLAIEADDRQKQRFALVCQEQLAQVVGDFPQAIARGRALVALARRDRFATAPLAVCLGNLAIALIRSGELDEAEAVGREAALLHARNGSLWAVLDGFALFACKRDRPRDAALALGRANALNRWRGGRREHTEQLACDEAGALLRRTLDAEALQLLLSEGETLTDEEAVRVALDGPLKPASP